MRKLPISVIVLTKNEELNLPHCMRSVAHFAGQILVVDSHSTDRTIAIAKEFGAETVEHDFVNQAEQFNWALDNLNIKNEWILRLDADEWITPELAAELSHKLSGASEDVSGFYIKRRVYFMGRWIKHGGYYPVWFLRLFRKGKGRSEVREMDEHIILLDGQTARLDNDFADDNQNGISRWVDKHNDYASREARSYFKEVQSGRVPGGNSAKLAAYYRLPIFIRPFIYFLARYVLLFGFLDGVEGLTFHFLQGLWYRFLIDVKIYEMRKAGKTQ